MFCSKCGAENSESAEFCSKCGNILKASPPPSGEPKVAGAPEISFGTIPAGQATFGVSTAFSNAINLVKSPAAFMRQNKDTNVPLNTTILGYVAILAAIPFVATLVGDLWYRSRFFFGYAIALAIGTYVLDIVAVFVIGFIIWKLAPSYSSTTTQAKATLLAAFVYTPVFLISILNIIPFIGWITFLGLLYGLYILYIGLPIMQTTPDDKVLTYVIVTVVLAVVVYAVIGAILGAIAAVFFLSSFL